MKVSNTKIDTFQRCGLYYKFQYVDNLKLNITSSPLLFGSAIDSALNYILESLRDKKEWTKEEAGNIFLNKMNEWDGSNRLDFFNSEVPEEIKEELNPNNPDHQEKVWENLVNRGINCIDVYIKEVLPQIEEVISVQNSGSIKNEEGDELVFIVDFICKMKDGRTVLMDNKTSSSKYAKNKVIKSQQLSLYLESFPEIKYAGYCVLIKDPEKIGATHQILIDEIPEETKQLAFDLVQNTTQKIKEEIFEHNFKNCRLFNKPCQYLNYCKYGDDTGLIKYKKDK